MRIRNLLSEKLNSALFGDRKKYGLIADHEDRDWQEWEKIALEAYAQTQHKSIGKIVNHSGYKVLKKINLNNKSILEIGPGMLEHSHYWNGIPERYALFDSRPCMLEISGNKLSSEGVRVVERFQSSSSLAAIPIEDNSIDFIFSFYSLEHLYPLENYLNEFKRILKKQGFLVGAIPAEGGLAWGLGRMLTTNLWFKKNTDINLNKIICWEHPNFSDDILKELNRYFKITYSKFWPFNLKVIDLNLTISFMAQKIN